MFLDPTKRAKGDFASTLSVLGCSETPIERGEWPLEYDDRLGQIQNLIEAFALGNCLDQFTHMIGLLGNPSTSIRLAAEIN
jgi:hypothetical protein